MFFKNISTYTKQKLFIIDLIFSLIYFILLVLAPTIIVCTNYKIFAKASNTRLTGVGICLFIIIGIFIYTKAKNAIDRLPEVKRGHQIFKFTTTTVFDCFPVILVLLGLAFAKNNIELAFETAKLCTIFILLANVVDGLFLKYIQAEKRLREKATELIEIEKRKELV